jgi:hypothetical protein
MTTATAPSDHAAAPRLPSELESLPRAGLWDARGIPAYFRPGAHRSSLRALGERFFLDVPGFPKSVLTCSPEDAKTVFSDYTGALSFGALLRRVTPHEPLFGSDAFIFLEGEEHIRERKRIAPPFHGQALRSYEQAMRELTLRRIEQWPVGQPLRFLKLGHQLALDVMMRVIFGVSEPARLARLERAMVEYGAIAESPLFYGFGMLSVVFGRRWRALPNLDRAAAAVDAIVIEEIEERRRSTSPPTDDVLALYLTLQEQDEEPHDDAFVAREMRGMMLAGYETTATSLGWVGEMLVRHPHVLDELVANVDRGEDAYLDAVIAEVMRLRPALPATGRRALRDFDLDGLRVPRGSMIIFSIIALHEREDIYEDPMAFRPERFLGERPGTYTWLPFGGGPHRCLGGSFALFEMRVLMRTLLQERRLERGGRPRVGWPEVNPMLVPPFGAPVVLRERG